MRVYRLRDALVGIALLAVLIGALAGCAGLQPAPKPIEVSVPVAVSCVDRSKLPEKPPLVTEAELALMNEGQVVNALARFYYQALSYIDGLEAIVKGCTK